MDNYNNNQVVAKRKLQTAIRYSKLAMGFSAVCFFYIIFLMLAPEVSFFSLAHVIILIVDRLLLYVFPILAVLFAIFGLQEKENPLRKTALLVSIISIVLSIMAIISIVLSITTGILGIFKNFVKNFA